MESIRGWWPENQNYVWELVYDAAAAASVSGMILSSRQKTTLGDLGSLKNAPERENACFLWQIVGVDRQQIASVNWI